MKNILLIIAVILLIGCSTYRKMSELTPQEKGRIDDLMSERKLCMVNEIEALDDGQTNVEYITELVNWKCDKYADQMKDLLYYNFKIELGDAWSRSNDLRLRASKEITEAILMKRKVRQQSEDENRLLKKGN